MPARPTPPRSLETYLRRIMRATGIMMATVVVTTAAVFAYLLWDLTPQLREVIEHARMVRILHESMLDQETGLRGFLLTGEPDAKEPYVRGREAMLDATQEAEDELATEPEFTRDYLALRLAEQRWVEGWAERAATGPEFATEAERDTFFAEGKVLFDEYRVAQERLIDRLTGKREELLVQQRRVLIVTAAVAFNIGMLLLAVAARERRRLRGAVVTPVQSLVDAMERIRHGDLTARAERSNTVEFNELGDALAGMAEQLDAARRQASEQATKLAERSDRQASVLSMARDIAGSLSPRYVLGAVAEHACHLAGADSIVLWLVADADGDGDGDPHQLVEAWSHDTYRVAGDGSSREVIQLGQGLPGEAARDGRSKSADEHGTPHLSVELGVPCAAVAIPMIVGARVVGIVEVRFTPSHVLEPEELSILETLAAHAGTAIEAARLHETTKKLSQLDALTRLYNRRRLDADLAAEVSRAQRYGRPLSFVMADLDHFKSFNDTYGHQRGDAVLQEVSRLLASSVRETDSVYRYGGEELAVLLRDTEASEAVVLAERLRHAVQQRFPGGGEQRAVTVSMGVATLRVGEVGAGDDLVGAADAALYRAKELGRNRVEGDAPSVRGAVSGDHRPR
ncbi:MAG: diguanylate cyclase [Actinomycetota bacterium]|nr:diguanylate cyclase [Actinomycetota bacterium]